MFKMNIFFIRKFLPWPCIPGPQHFRVSKCHASPVIRRGPGWGGGLIRFPRKLHAFSRNQYACYKQHKKDYIKSIYNSIWSFNANDFIRLLLCLQKINKVKT